MNELLNRTYHTHGGKGFVEVIDVMGDDSSVVQGARVSYGDGTKTVREDRSLIRYLMRHRHTTPFEMCEVKFHVRAPIFVARQWMRHRSGSFNEVSARYSELDDGYYVPHPSALKRQGKSNKQGTGEALGEEEAATANYLMTMTAETCREAYVRLLEDDTYRLSREQARMVLPVNTFTEFYWKVDLHNLLHFLNLRARPNAQAEIRDPAENILHGFVCYWVPHTYEAFMDYVFEAVTLSAPEVEVLRGRIDGLGERPDGMTEREWRELMERFKE